MKQIFSLFQSRSSLQPSAAELCALRLRRSTAQHKAAAEEANATRTIYALEKTPVGAMWRFNSDFLWNDSTPSSRPTTPAPKAPSNAQKVISILEKIPQTVREILAA